MFPFNQTIVRRSWYLSRLPDNRKDPFADPAVQAATNGEGEEPRHGDELAYEEGMEMGKSRIVAGLMSFTLFGFFALFSYSKLVSGATAGFYAVAVTQILMEYSSGSSSSSWYLHKAPAHPTRMFRSICSLGWLCRAELPLVGCKRADAELQTCH